jgi:hypothetical protein
MQIWIKSLIGTFLMVVHVIWRKKTARQAQFQRMFNIIQSGKCKLMGSSFTGGDSKFELIILDGARELISSEGEG